MKRIILLFILLSLFIFPSVALGNLLPNGGMEITNLLSNGNFERGNPPAQWNLSGAGATVVQSGTEVKVGSYSAALTRNGANCNIYQNAWTDNSMQSQTFILGAWIWCDTAFTSVMEIWDGVAGTFSANHTGGSSWEWITVTKTLAAGASQNTPILYVLTNDTTVYYDGVILLEGSYFPPEWIPSAPNQMPNALNETPQSHVYSGSYSLSLERSGTDLYSSGTVPFQPHYASEPFSTTVQVWSGTPSIGKICIYDGVDEYCSPLNSGTEAWEELSISATTDALATELGIRLYIEGTDTIIYYDAADLYGALCTGSIGGIVGSQYEPSESGTIYSQLFDENNEPLNTSRITYEIIDNSGNIVDVGTLSYIAGTDGQYSVDFTAPSTEGTYALGIKSNIPNLCGSTDIQVRTGNQWWEDNMLLFGLIFLSCVLLGIGYGISRSELVISGGAFLFIAGGYGFTESGTHVIYPVLGLAACLIALVFILSGASMWRSAREENEDRTYAENDFDDDDFNDDWQEDAGDGFDEKGNLIQKKRKGSPRLNRQTTNRRRQPMNESARIRNEARDMDM